MDAEMLLNDLISVERKLERLADEHRKGGGREKTEIERESELFERMQAALSAEQPLRDLFFSPDDERILSGFGLLTMKPILILFNLGEGQESLDFDYQHSKSLVSSLQGKLEMEITQLAPDEAAIFLEEYGIEEPGLERIIHQSHNLLGLISFFTIGDEEVRAWTVPDGETAHEAAGRIHSDIYKGFIRAEIIAWDELVALGGLSAARSTGKLRLEGKDYRLQDGEVMQVRFNI
jgi:ribosome-binding ATPase YchF (GTP1/OBG family)